MAVVATLSKGYGLDYMCGARPATQNWPICISRQSAHLVGVTLILGDLTSRCVQNSDAS